MKGYKYIPLIDDQRVKNQRQQRPFLRREWLRNGIQEHEKDKRKGTKNSKK